MWTAPDSFHASCKCAGDYARMGLVLALTVLAAAYVVVAQAQTLPASSAPTAQRGVAGGAGLVLQDAVALRGAARDSAAVQAQLWRGESLEIRGERQDFYQVWDYRRERGGYVRKSQLMPVGSAPGDAADLLAMLRVVRRDWENREYSDLKLKTRAMLIGLMR